MAFFSIIIPAYNCEKYLKRAVESVCCQPVQDMEILLVDDGSTDSTGQLCDQLAEKIRGNKASGSSAVTVIHQENRGVSAARNAGIRRASGEYLLFLDADDAYADNAIDSRLVEECHQGYDVILFSSLTGNVDRDRYGIDMEMRDGIFPGGQAYPISGHFGAAVYKKQLLLEHQILFDEGIHLNEDMTFKMKAMYAAALIRTRRQPLYIYNTTPGSVRYRDRHIQDYMEAWIKTDQWLEQYGTGGNLAQAKAFVQQKIISRQLLYAKLYIQQGHTLQEMMSELQRIKALETLKNLPMKDMIPSQRDELRLFQQKPEKFVRYARKESRKIRIGRLLLKIRLLRRIRDRRKYPGTLQKGVRLLEKGREDI